MQTGQQDNQPMDQGAPASDMVSCPKCGCEFSASTGGEKEPEGSSAEGSTTASGEPSIMAKLMAMKGNK